MDLNKIHKVYLIGIGGIGMSALARWFYLRGCKVSGYDRSESAITTSLGELGIQINYDDNVDNISSNFLAPDQCVIIYTPAISDTNKQLIWFREHNFIVLKRAVVLGIISENMKGIAVAGTHGKTSVSTLIAYLMNSTKTPVNAFLGGISVNFNSNLVFAPNSNTVVLEADEFDRSFLFLAPQLAVITHIDADHLDIYGSHNQVIEAFVKFSQNIKSNGSLFCNKTIESLIPKLADTNMYTYAYNDSNADYYAEITSVQETGTIFNLITPETRIEALKLPQVGKHHIENAVVAISVALNNGVSVEQIRNNLQTFLGVKRRYEHICSTESIVYIDDYAHHPRELQVTIEAVRMQFPGKYITGIFQPHLFTRTRDFADEFANVLSLLDELILLDIYPAREEEIPGVNSKIILDKVTLKNKKIINQDDLLKSLKIEKPRGVLLTMGAGDIDRMVQPIKTILTE
jgi:UDP-N-acetylmuramate--alanine ligase